MKIDDKTCTPAPCPQRPEFRKRQQLTAERLNRLHEIQTQKMRQALLGIAGSGVIYGFDIETDDVGRCEKADDECIEIGCGLAIDGHGRLLYWPGGKVCVKDLVGRRPERSCRYTLRVHYAETGRQDEELHPCNDGKYDWVEECVVFSLEQGCSEIGRKCPELPYDCPDTGAYICGRLGAGNDELKDRSLEKICCAPEKLEYVHCRDTFYDLHGIPLACVKIDSLPVPGECEPQLVFGRVEQCGHRPFVYRNPLLFELIQGCDDKATRVVETSVPREWLSDSWRESNAVSWDDFERCIRKGINITFSQPVRPETLNRASVFITAIVGEQESFFDDVVRLPAIITPSVDGRSVRLEVPEAWKRRQFDENRSRFNYGAVIEITVRGSLVRDHCCCMLDGRPFLPGDKCHRAMPGGDFVAAFCVDPRPYCPEEHPSKMQSAQRPY